MSAPAFAGSVYQDLVDHIGESGAAMLCDKLGGTNLYVPKKLTPEHPLALAIGMDSASLLVEQFRGDILLLPKGRRASRAKVLELRRTTSMTIKQIALATGYHVRQVSRIIDEDEKQRQHVLF